MKISITILTFKRKKLLLENLSKLTALLNEKHEIIVIDNYSQEGISEAVNEKFPNIKVLALSNNCGTEGRNIGIKAATGDIVITLDDDVFDLTEEDIKVICEEFKNNSQLGALCFRVKHALSLKTINWSHQCEIEKFADKPFITKEISEGAVAINRKAFIEAGGYPGEFFISHEGPELAIRLMNRGYEVQYTPKVEVLHHQSTLGRPGWRRYYYDTRNTIWLVIRNYPLIKGLGFLLIQLSAMFIYSVRDGFLIYWFKGTFDAFKDIQNQLKQREAMSDTTKRTMLEISKNNEPFFKKVKRRLFNNSVSI